MVVRAKCRTVGVGGRNPSDNRRAGRSHREMILAVVVVAIGVVLGAFAVTVYRNHLRNPRPDSLSQRFEYSLEAYIRIPPQKLGFEPAWHQQIPGSEIRTLCVAGSTAWIAADKTLLPVELSADGARLGTPVVLTEPPACVAVAFSPSEDQASSTRFFVGSGNRVLVVDAAGKVVSQWAFFGEKALITDIVVGGEDVFVADAGNRVVHRLDRHGEKIAELGHRDAERGIPGFIVPSPYFDLAWGTDGLLRVVNPGARRIEIYTPDGDLEIFWGKSGLEESAFCGCCNPAHIALFSDGRVVTAEKGIPRVKVYSPQGDLLTWVASPDHFAAASELEETRDEERLPVLDVGVFTVTDGAGAGSEWVLVLDPGRKVLEAYRPKNTRDRSGGSVGDSSSNGESQGDVSYQTHIR